VYRPVASFAFTPASTRSVRRPSKTPGGFERRCSPDLAAHVSGRPLERALNEARALRLPDRPSLHELIDRYPGRRGIRAAREALALFEAGPTPTRSELEERFLALSDRHGLPRPLMNRRVRTPAGTFRVDCIWPELRVIVELDAWSTHSSRMAMLTDRRRDRALRIAGWHPSRVYSDDFDDEERLLADLRALLVPPAERRIGHPAA
jgi:very-short-patch-repair endonuclease